MKDHAIRFAGCSGVFKLDSKAGMGMVARSAAKPAVQTVSKTAARHAAPAKLAARPAKPAGDEEWEEF